MIIIIIIIFFSEDKYFEYKPKAESSFTTQLPNGNLTVRVRCEDVFGGFSEAFGKVTHCLFTEIPHDDFRDLEII